MCKKIIDNVITKPYSVILSTVFHAQMMMMLEHKLHWIEVDHNKKAERN